MLVSLMFKEKYYLIFFVFFTDKKRGSLRTVLGNLNSSNNCNQDCKIEPQLDGLEDIPTRSRKRTDGQEKTEAESADPEDSTSLKGLDEFLKDLI